MYQQNSLEQGMYNDLTQRAFDALHDPNNKQVTPMTVLQTMAQRGVPMDVDTVSKFLTIMSQARAMEGTYLTQAQKAQQMQLAAHRSEANRLSQLAGHLDKYITAIGADPNMGNEKMKAIKNYATILDRLQALPVGPDTQQTGR